MAGREQWEAKKRNRLGKSKREKKQTENKKKEGQKSDEKGKQRVKWKREI